jgi:glutaredoxin 3
LLPFTFIFKVDATIVELDQMDEGDAIQADLAEMTGQRTVPSVFIKGACRFGVGFPLSRPFAGTHIGGNDDTQQALASGKLEEMLGV